MEVTPGKPRFSRINLTFRVLEGTMLSIDLDQDEVASSALAGVFGTLVFGGIFMAVGNTGTIAVAIPALYGLQGPSLALGWMIHLVHGAVLGLVYALIVSGTGYGHHLDRVPKATVWGLGYGALTALLLAGLLMPVWLSSVGFPNAPSVPNFSLQGLAGHVLYGAALGAAYPVLRGLLSRS